MQYASPNEATNCWKLVEYIFSLCVYVWCNGSAQESFYFFFHFIWEIVNIHIKPLRKIQNFFFFIATSEFSLNDNNVVHIHILCSILFLFLSLSFFPLILSTQSRKVIAIKKIIDRCLQAFNGDDCALLDGFWMADCGHIYVYVYV